MLCYVHEYIKIIYVNCGLKNYMKVDHCSYRQPRPQGFSLKKWVGPGKDPGIGWSRVYLTP